MEYIAGDPIMREKMEKDEQLKAISTLVKLQCRVHAITADELPNQADRLTWKINHNDYIELAVKNKLISRLCDLNIGSKNLCHGDFHPLNVLFDGNKYWIIDWVDATMGNPLADACRTYLIFGQILTRLAGTYLRLFCEETNIEKEAVLEWLPVIAGARLSEKMDDKARAMMLSIISESV